MSHPKSLRVRLTQILVLFLFHPLTSQGQNYTRLKDWTLEEKAGQLLLVGFHSIDQVEQNHPGGVVLFSWNMKAVDSTKKLTSKLNEIAVKKLKAPLFIAADHEGGKVLRLRKGLTGFPDAAAVGALKDSYTAFQVGKHMGLELSSLGINMNLAPVLDLGNARSFLENRIWSENPFSVGELTSAFIQGLEASRIFPVAKHFPGHGGTTQDSHFAMPRIEKSFARVWKEDLEPFREVIREHVPGIMTAHVEIPSIDNGAASLSKKFIDEILRKKMGYEGLVITDDLEMGGVVARDGTGVEELAMKALQAGTDMILVVWSESAQVKIINRVVRAVRDHEISEQWLNAKVERILNAKNQYLHKNPSAFQNPYWRSNLRRRAAIDLAKKITEGAIRWQAGDSREILNQFANKWQEAWTVVLPSEVASQKWGVFRSKDKIFVAKRNPNRDESRTLRTLLDASEGGDSPLIVMTGPRASSSEETFGIVRRSLSKMNAKISPNKPVLWVHQGARPVELGRDPASLRLGLLSLYSSSRLSLDALMAYLKQETERQLTTKR